MNSLSKKVQKVQSKQILRFKKIYQDSFHKIVKLSNFEFLIAATGMLSSSSGSTKSTMNTMMYGNMAINLVL